MRSTLALVVSVLVIPAAAVAGRSREAAADDASAGTTLTILHVNDGESVLLDSGPGLEEFGGAARLASVVERLRAEAREAGTATLTLSAGDNYEPGASLAAWRESGSLADAEVLTRIGLDASAIGNHEFDLGPDLFADFVRTFDGDTVFVSSNLDVSRVPELAGLAGDGSLAREATFRVGGVTVGVVGATTQLLPSISSPGRVRVESPVPTVQAAIDRLQAGGARIIVLLSHLQGITEDRGLLGQLRGVDVVVSGGGAELLADPGDALLPGDERAVAGPYPSWAVDADDRKVPIVTTPGHYRYVGRLVARFDANGELVDVAPQSGPVRVASSRHPGGVAAHRVIDRRAIRPLREFVEPLERSVVATLHVPLDGRRSILRSAESNEGNLIADAMMWAARRAAQRRDMPPPSVALLNAGSIRHDSRLARGTKLTGLDILHATPFANELIVLPAISPARLKDVLENAVSRVADADGRFVHVAGLRYSWRDGEDGARIREIVLDDPSTGERVLVREGRVVSEHPVSVVTTDFIQRGGDDHPLDGTEGVALGITTSQALSDYLATALGGAVRASDYPPGGEGRIVRLQ